MKLSSLFGLDARLRRLRIAAGEGALAAEDRFLLLRMAWEDEKQRFKWVLVLVIAVLGLTTVAAALLSVAVVVHFWETPSRVVAAWSVAAVWIALWLAAGVALLLTLNGARSAFTPTRREFERDWAWAQRRFGLGSQGDEDTARQQARLLTQDELLARIERQRQRIAVLETPAPPPAPGAPPPDESPSAAALRIAKQHPVASGVAAAAVVAVFGPRRLLRWAALIAPVLWRMR